MGAGNARKKSVQVFFTFHEDYGAMFHAKKANITARLPNVLTYLLVFAAARLKKPNLTKNAPLHVANFNRKRYAFTN